jgi:hypothetical protein
MSAFIPTVIAEAIAIDRSEDRSPTAGAALWTVSISAKIGAPSKHRGLVLATLDEMKSAGTMKRRLNADFALDSLCVP